MSCRDEVLTLPPAKMQMQHVAEIAARADARIAELETAMKRQAAAVKMFDMSNVARAETMMQHAQVLHDQSNTAALESERAANAIMTARIAELEKERDALREFAVEIMGHWPHGDVDGGDLQNMAIKHKLIAPKNPKPTEPCGEYCACAGYPTQEEWAEGIDCYAWTPLLIWKIDAARGAG